MSKRARPQLRAPQPIDVISLLDDSSSASEDDPDDPRVLARPGAANATRPPAKRLRRLPGGEDDKTGGKAACQPPSIEDLGDEEVEAVEATTVAAPVAAAATGSRAARGGTGGTAAAGARKAAAGRRTQPTSSQQQEQQQEVHEVGATKPAAGKGKKATTAAGAHRGAKRQVGLPLQSQSQALNTQTRTGGLVPLQLHPSPSASPMSQRPSQSQSQALSQGASQGVRKLSQGLVAEQEDSDVRCLSQPSSQPTASQQQRKPQLRQLLLQPVKKLGSGGAGGSSSQAGADAPTQAAPPGAAAAAEPNRRGASAWSKMARGATATAAAPASQGVAPPRPTLRSAMHGSAAASAATAAGASAAPAPGTEGQVTAPSKPDAPSGPTGHTGGGDGGGGGGGGGVHAGAGGGGGSGKGCSSLLVPELWPERHAPRSEDELVEVVHRKKVAEVREWLQQQRAIMDQAAAAAAAAGAVSQGGCGGPGRPGWGSGSSACGGSGVGWQAAGSQAGPLASQVFHGVGTQQPQNGRGWGQQQRSEAYGSQTYGSQRQGPSFGAGPRRPQPCGVAVLSGPAGCGKSATVRVLAGALGLEVVEWTPPPPMLWSEYQYQRPNLSSYGGGSVPYQSKLDDFEAFLARSKFPSLQLTRGNGPAEGSAPGSASGCRPGAAPLALSGRAATGSGGNGTGASGGTEVEGGGRGGAVAQHRLLLLEDLPHTHDAERRQRLAASLRDLAAGTRCPVVVIATEAEGAAAGPGWGGGGGRGGGGGGGGVEAGSSMGGSKGLHKELLGALQSCGAATISFNPITANNIAKLLLKVASLEGVELSPAVAVGLAEAADGDLRSALQAAHMQCVLQRAAAAAAERGDGDGDGEDRPGAGRGKGGGKKQRKAAAKGSGGGRKGAGPSATTLVRNGRQQQLSAGEVAALAAAQRDLGLSPFHALGKILYNKRLAVGTNGLGDGQDDAEDAAGDEEDDDDEWAPTQRRKPGAGAGAGSKAGKGGGRGAAAGGSGGGGGRDPKDKDSMALKQLQSHALGGSRTWMAGVAAGIKLHPRHARAPSRYDPESVTSRCGMEAPALLAFLHENYPSFVGSGLAGQQGATQQGPGHSGGEEGGEKELRVVEDVAAIAAYLSDSAVLCGQSRSAATAATSWGGSSLWSDDAPAAASIASAVAASVAVRGYMYANAHPAPHSFNPIRAPAANAIEAAANANRAQLRAAACRLAVAAPQPSTAPPNALAAAVPGMAGHLAAASTCFGVSASELVSGVIPWLRPLVQGSYPHASWLAGALPQSWTYYWKGAITEGGFVPFVAQPPQVAAGAGGWGRGSGGGGTGGSVGGGGAAPAADVNGMLEQLGIEDDDPIEE